jgi:hypothetical protein
MAQVQIDEVVYHLSFQMKRALKDAVEKTIPGVNFDDSQLFRNFKSAVWRKCSQWENVPDRYVKK